jgi:tRNA-2-methylthio-N6-dimethylallyladenosine synthase
MTAQEHRQNELKQRYPYVDIVLGSSAWQRLPELLYRRLTGEKRLFCLDGSDTIPEGIPVKHEFSYKAWLPVMYGCNNFCSYCIVPYVRGRERSRRPEDIVAEARDLVAHGCRDITLLGQNVNSYGRDLGTGYDFADLIKDISAIDGDFRLRFMTSHPKDATRKLVDALAASDKAARHFHLPLQSGSDRILKAMNRRYDRKKYLDVVAYIREKMPDIALTTDIIVGFPGETEEDFEDTLDIIKRVRYDMIFSFVFSPRRGTPAAEMENQVPFEIKTQRYLALVDLQNTISEEINRKFQDSVVRVLCDGPSKTNKSLYSGRTSENKIVFFHGEPDDIGNFVNVKVERTEAFALYGEKTDKAPLDNR